MRIFGIQEKTKNGGVITSEKYRRNIKCRILKRNKETVSNYCLALGLE